MDQQNVGDLLQYLRAQSGRSQNAQAAVLSDLSGRAISRNEISRWENETRLPTPYWQEHVAKSFGVDVAVIRRAVADTRTRRRREMPGGTLVPRREFLGAMATLAVPLTVGAAPPPGGRVGQAQVAQLARRTARLRRLDNVIGGADTYQVYAAEVDATAHLLRSARCTAEVERQLHALLAEQLQQAGWAAFDAGDHTTARRCYDESGKAAAVAAAPELAANALAYRAYQMTATDQNATATAAASCEVAQDGGASPRVEALLLERRAWAHATAGEAQAADTALNQAREALQTTNERTEPDWVFWVDEAEIDIMAGRCWTELRRPLRAVPVLERVLSTFDDTHARDKALYLTWLATSYIQAHEVEQAAATLDHALDLATDVASVRPAMRIRSVARQLSRHRTLPGVAAVLDRVGA